MAGAAYPSPATEGRSANMRANRRTDTGPEVALRGALHRKGYRYRKDHRLDLAPGVRVRPDIVFTARKVAVFVDGCFWHACPEHGRQPAVNEWYWAPKLRRTVERDAAADAALRAAGWRVVRIWEHVAIDEALAAVLDAIGPRHPPGRAAADGSAGAAGSAGAVSSGGAVGSAGALGSDGAATSSGAASSDGAATSAGAAGSGGAAAGSDGAAGFAGAVEVVSVTAADGSAVVAVPESSAGVIGAGAVGSSGAVEAASAHGDLRQAAVAGARPAGCSGSAADARVADG